MMGELYKNGIQGMYWCHTVYGGDDTDSMGFCDLDDERVQTIGVQVPMHFGYAVNFYMNCDRLGWIHPEQGQERFDNALEAARLFVAAPDLLAVVERLQAWGKNAERATMANLADIIHDANTALAKAKEQTND